MNFLASPTGPLPTRFAAQRRAFEQSAQLSDGCGPKSRVPVEIILRFQPKMAQPKNTPFEISMQSNFYKAIRGFRPVGGPPGKTELAPHERSVVPRDLGGRTGTAMVFNLESISAPARHIAALRVMPRNANPRLNVLGHRQRIKNLSCIGCKPKFEIDGPCRRLHYASHGIHGQSSRLLMTASRQSKGKIHIAEGKALSAPSETSRRGL